MQLIAYSLRTATTPTITIREADSTMPGNVTIVVGGIYIEAQDTIQ
jgi:hypothetical protein